MTLSVCMMFFCAAKAQQSQVQGTVTDVDGRESLIGVNVLIKGSSTGTITDFDGKYTLDPGSPDAQNYLISIVRELTDNYAIDGIHWDYIRYTNANAGYPAYAWYDKSGLARFQDITGYVGTPPE